MARTTDRSERADRGRRPPGEYWDLSRRLLSSAFRGKPIREFIADVGREFLDFTDVDECETRVRSRGSEFRHICGRDSTPAGRLSVRTSLADPIPADSARSDFELICEALLAPLSGGGASVRSQRGRLVVGDSHQPLRRDGTGSERPGETYDLSGKYRSLLFLLFGGDRNEDGDRGLVVLRSRKKDFFRPEDVAHLEEVAKHLELAFVDRRTHLSLRERVKELTCLYRIALLVEQPRASLEEILQGVVEVLPEAWLYPADAWARLTVDDATYAAGRICPEKQRLEADILVAGVRRGHLQVGYVEDRPALDEGPFLHEERRLIDTVAREVALIIERRDVAEKSRKLQEQLIHTERLATIGELSAGIAHELNDPLNNILGFAQLMEKNPGLTAQMAKDLERIVASALHSRQVIQQLLMFARRMPQRRSELDLGRLVEDAYSFLQALCSQGDIELVRRLAPDLPPISGDADQLRQVLVNLVVNASQAMPHGGRLTISTGLVDEEEGFVRLVVEDTGLGMSEEVMTRAFLPFFTTRKEGTGLGLAVVHGIVTSHGGSIQVQSQSDRGTRFEVRLPAIDRRGTEN